MSQQTQWISGNWVAGLGDAFQSLSPYDNNIIWEGQSATPEQVELAVSSARKAFVEWKKRPFAEREAIVLAFATRLKSVVKRLPLRLPKKPASRYGRPVLKRVRW
ncbi:succinylglutamic semialdehyde dehydrogenase [Vibrio maritimus]|uniref:Succinylglutamic semialdehyde dehydrogenase n=1 Tax=Vibrio maritimus TaxID=990268 RepID=A0A090TCW7_9VIBR|nr:succinylglutamic semialdehyde dehydrogenase [Vibrio maritimus]